MFFSFFPQVAQNKNPPWEVKTKKPRSRQARFPKLAEISAGKASNRLAMKRASRVEVAMGSFWQVGNAADGGNRHPQTAPRSETRVGTITFVGYVGESNHSLGFLRWREMDFATIHSIIFVVFQVVTWGLKFAEGSVGHGSKTVPM